ncbi:glycosyltransferase [Vibrio fluvialis]|nr:glycosyltransferase [Vibrio fluvialis]
MKKILHIINNVDAIGGAEKIVKELCELEIDGYEHRFVNIYKNTDNLTSVKKIYYIILFLFKVLKLRKGSDIYHFHLFPAFYFSVFFKSEKCIIHEHNTSNRRRNLHWFKFIEKYIYSRVKYVICISKSTEENLLGWCGQLDNTVCIPNFSRFKYINCENNIKDDEVNLVMAASFTKQKNHELVIEAVSLLNNSYNLYLLGDGPNKHNIEELVIKKGITNRVHFAGNVDNVDYFYRKCNLSLLISHWEGFGMVVVEAASFNRPTLCSNVTGLSTVVNNNQLLFEGSAEELAFKIENIIKLVDNEHDYFTDYCMDLSENYSLDKFITNVNFCYE